jgi:hypothetical protein
MQTFRLYSMSTYQPTDEEVQKTLLQCPSDVNEFQVRELLIALQGDHVAVALYVWNIPTPTTRKEPTKWDEIREICDAYDVEMEKRIVHTQKST